MYAKKQMIVDTNIYSLVLSASQRLSPLGDASKPYADALVSVLSGRLSHQEKPRTFAKKEHTLSSTQILV